MAIEKLQPGDSVLAQNPETGKLAFKPVWATTVRPTSPLIEIRGPHKTIRATRGHPFWVCGIGWQMAKELKDRSATAHNGGACGNPGCTAKGRGRVLQPVVADFNSYLIGSDQILVYDNNLSQVSSATIPGFTVSKLSVPEIP